tara:strand:- start:3675 stop:4541 length:867 start_codon:yes stop_codon:yes gene_type:complete
MSRQYKRTYDLTVIPTDGESRVIKDLRISFEITKSILSFPNLCKLVIYNPNQETLSALQNKFTKIVLNVGYEGDVRLLFKGEVRNVFQMKSGVDRLITVYAGDGERDWQNATFNKTFSETVTINKAIEEVLKSFEEVSTGAIEGLPQGADKLRGQTLSGSSKDIMDEFANEYGFDWSIQDGEIVITPIESPLQNNEAVLLTAATGMLGSPTVTEIGANAVSLLNPRLLPNRAFKIESVNADIQLGNLFFRGIKKTSAEGTYKIQEVVFKGDSREGEWTSSVKGRAINA